MHRKAPNLRLTVVQNVSVGATAIDLASALSALSAPVLPQARRWGRLAGRVFKNLPFYSSDLEMDESRWRAAPSKKKALTTTNAALQAGNAELKKANDKLETERDQLRQTIKSLQVVVSVLLGSSAGIAVGLAIGIAGIAAGTALTAAITVFFAVIMASMAILNYMRRPPA